MRRKCGDMFHTYDNYVFSDLLRKQDMWEDHPSLKILKPNEWNTVFLNRISDVHRHMCQFVQVVEPKLLLKNVMLKRQEEEAPLMSHDDTGLMNSTSKILEGCRFLHREAKEYTRLIDSL
jgi:hypothetical protein